MKKETKGNHWGGGGEAVAKFFITVLSQIIEQYHMIFQTSSAKVSVKISVSASLFCIHLVFSFIFCRK